jgi:soluble P-type ATPase
MTEKRFKLNRVEQVGSTLINITYDDGKTLFNLGDACEVLNEQHETIQQLNDRIEDLYESDRALRKMCSNATHNWTGICVKRELFEETLKTLKELGCEDLADDLSKTSIVTGINGC